MNESLMNTYSRLPVSFVRGEGVWLWDNEGNKCLDALSGVAVCSLGHAHPAVTAAVSEQVGMLVHTSNWYGIPHQQALADQLIALSGMDNAFFKVLDMTGIVAGSLTCILTVAMFWKAKKYGDRKPEYTVHKNKIVGLILIAMFVAATFVSFSSEIVP